MNCLICKTGNMIDSKEAYIAQFNGCYIIIENVPCKKCDQCGEVLFSSKVMEKIDDIISNVQNIASKIFIMDYNQAA